MALLLERLQSLLSEFVAGRQSLEAFEETFAALTLEAYAQHDQATQEMCRTVEWHFLDCQRGLISVDGLTKALALCVERKWATPVEEAEATVHIDEVHSDYGAKSMSASAGSDLRNFVPDRYNTHSLTNELSLSIDS